MILYHFTGEEYVDAIREHGIVPLDEKKRLALPVVCSDGEIRPATGMQLPPPMFAQENSIVWLTKNPEPTTTDLWKTTVRVHVDVGQDGATRWARAADRYGVPPIWRKTIDDTGVDPQNWYIVEGMIAPEQIVAIDHLEPDRTWTEVRVA